MNSVSSTFHTQTICCIKKQKANLALLSFFHGKMNIRWPNHVFLNHFSFCQDDVLPGTRSIFGLKRPVIPGCQAALFDGAVSLLGLSVKQRGCCQSQTSELRQVTYMTFRCLGGRIKIQEKNLWS